MSRFPGSSVRDPESVLAGPSRKRRRILSGRGFVNAMFVFAPIALVGDWLDLGGTFIFACAALACIPMSYWLGQSTESLAGRLGPVSGGLLNATFGNAPELIISILALSHGLFIVVRAALSVFWSYVALLTSRLELTTRSFAAVSLTVCVFVNPPDEVYSVA